MGWPGGGRLMSSMARVLEAAKGTPTTFQLLKQRPSLAIEAFVLVCLLGILHGLPAAILQAENPPLALVTLAGSILRALLAWVFVGTIAYAIAAFFFRARANWLTTLGALGYTTAPFVLPVAFGFSPALLPLAYLIALSWSGFLIF